jgi:beta-glucosidase
MRLRHRSASPSTSSPCTRRATIDVEAARVEDALRNRWFLDPVLRGEYPADGMRRFGSMLPPFAGEDMRRVSAPIDFLGVNYYRRHVVAAGADGEPVVVDPRGAETTGMGWEIYPQGLHELLVQLHEEYPVPPLYVTENGAAFDSGIHDADRIEYLTGHFAAAERAIADGVDLRGYFVWSLLDNFEWAYGYSKRFGLIHVDYETLARTPKDSAVFYAAVTRANGLPG